MKTIPSLFLFLALTASAVAQPVTPPKPVPKPAVPLVPAAMTAKGGELLLIDVSKAPAAVLFDFDATIFDVKHATIDAKKLYLAIPRNDATKTYAITVISEMPLSTARVTITVPGDVVPVPIPVVDPLAQMKTDIAKLQTDVASIAAAVAALQKPPVPVPVPVPVDALAAAVQAAYLDDGKPAAAAASLAALYRQSGPTVNNTASTKTSDVLAAMHTAAQTLIADQLPAVRRVIADELNAQLGKTDVPLTATSRALISAQFLRAQKALEGVK